MTTNQTRSRQSGRPPKWLFKYGFNPLMTLILRSPLHGRMSHVLALLTFSGRKSGKRYTIPVGYHPQGDEILVFTVSPWWKNLRGGAAVTMRLKGRDVAGWAEVERDPDTLLAWVEPFVRQRGPADARRTGLLLDPDHDYTSAELRAEIERQGLTMTRIRPEATQAKP